VAAVSFVAVANLRRGWTGRRWLAVRGNEAAAAACGVDVVRTKLLASAVAVGLAGVAGVLIAQNSQKVEVNFFFASVETPLVFALLVVGILGALSAAGVFSQNRLE